MNYSKAATELNEFIQWSKTERMGRAGRRACKAGIKLAFSFKEAAAAFRAFGKASPDYKSKYP